MGFTYLIPKDSCPFCGETSTRINSHKTNFLNGKDIYMAQVHCTKCRARGPGVFFEVKIEPGFPDLDITNPSSTRSQAENEAIKCWHKLCITKPETKNKTPDINHITVKGLFKLCADNMCVKVYQVPIKEIDSSSALVCRQVGDIATLLDSNQNYLNFHIESLQMDNDLLCIVCKANQIHQS